MSLSTDRPSSGGISQPPGALIVGLGPGVSGSLARACARSGYRVAMIGLDPQVLQSMAQELDGPAPAVWRVADLADDRALAAAVGELGQDAGHLALLHYNPSAWRAVGPLELTPDQLLADMRVGVTGLLTAVQAARPYLQRGSRITATGSAAADSGSSVAPSLGVQKAALRNLVMSLDAALEGDDVRAVSVTVDGVLAPGDPGSPFHPDRVAEALLAAARQPADAWQAHLRHPHA